jgi:hypothetical protein
MEQLPTGRAALGGDDSGLTDTLQALLLPMLEARETGWDSVAPFPCQQHDAEHLTDLLARVGDADAGQDELGRRLLLQHLQAHADGMWRLPADGG